MWGYANSCTLCLRRAGCQSLPRRRRRRRVIITRESQASLSVFNQSDRLRFEPGKDFLKILIAERAREDFSQHGTIIAGDLYLPAPGILHPQPLGLGGDERRNISTTASPNLIESPQYDRLCSGSLTNRYGSHLCGSLKFQFAGSAE